MARWEDATSPHCQAAKLLLQGDSFHQALVDGLNETFLLPGEVTIVYRETGKLNAWYDRAAHRITVSYDLASSVITSFTRPEDRFQALGRTRATMNFIILHEVGHALMAELALPVVAAEEDAADEFATLYQQLVGAALGPELALAAAEWFGRNGERNTPLSRLPYWDEHSLNEQRYFDILSDLFASDPNRFASLADKIPLPRRQEAIARFPAKVRSWRRLTAAHRKAPDGLTLLTGKAPAPGAGSLVFRARPKTGLLTPPDELWRIGAYQRIIPALNAGFLLPRPITVTADYVGSTSHQNNLIEGKITFSQEASEQTMAGIQKLNLAPERARQLLRSFEDFALLCQFCRTLIYEYDLPITGPIDEAAEDLAALLVVDHPAMRPILLDIAFFYSRQDDTGERWQSPALGRQKLATFLGYLFIEAPTSYPQYPSLLPTEVRDYQLARIQYDYVRKKEAWSKLLGYCLRAP